MDDVLLTMFQFIKLFGSLIYFCFCFFFTNCCLRKSAFEGRRPHNLKAKNGYKYNQLKALIFSDSLYDS